MISSSPMNKVIADWIWPIAISEVHIGRNDEYRVGGLAGVVGLSHTLKQ